MAIVCLLFGAGLVVSAWRVKTVAMRALLLALALANAGAAAKMVGDGYPYALRLEPQRTAPGIQDDPKPWRR